MREENDNDTFVDTSNQMSDEELHLFLDAWWIAAGVGVIALFVYLGWREMS